MRLLTYLPLGGTFTLLWPAKSVLYGDQVTSDKFYYESDESKKRALTRSIRNSSQGDDSINTTIITAEKPQLWYDEWKRIMAEETDDSIQNRKTSSPNKVYTDIR